MRINKYLADKNYSTRRGADKLIEKGVVFINGKKAVLGDQVEETDEIEVRDKSKQKEYVYIAYNKPRGIVTSLPQGEEQDIKSLLQATSVPTDVFPLGRLDKESRGLIILTNDGRITDRLLNPKFEHEKEYEVQTQDRLRDSFESHMAGGVEIGEDSKTKPCTVKRTSDNSFKVVLGEGKRHQIRRMVMALHNTVTDLRRTRILNIKLGSLKEGEYRIIEGKELKDFLTTLSIIK
ncbi:MAG: RNA pseudouridine synthase [bacterium]|nr:RNA pseudouridine synthase [bacterium]